MNKDSLETFADEGNCLIYFLYDQGKKSHALTCSSLHEKCHMPSLGWVKYIVVQRGYTSTSCLHIAKRVDSTISL